MLQNELDPNQKRNWPTHSDGQIRVLAPKFKFCQLAPTLRVGHDFQLVIVAESLPPCPLIHYK